MLSRRKVGIVCAFLFASSIWLAREPGFGFEESTEDGCLVLEVLPCTIPITSQYIVSDGCWVINEPGYYECLIGADVEATNLQRTGYYLAGPGVSGFRSLNHVGSVNCSKTRNCKNLCDLYWQLDEFDFWYFEMRCQSNPGGNWSPSGTSWVLLEGQDSCTGQ